MLLFILSIIPFLLSAEDTLWTGIPGDYTDPRAPEVLSKVRKLVNEGQYAEATTAAVQLSGKPSEVYCLIIMLFLKVEFILF